jgi:hypothetical protein
MSQCKSEDQDFKSYADEVFRCSCCCLPASLTAKTLTEMKENMGQCQSKEGEFKE